MTLIRYTILGVCARLVDSPPTGSEVAAENETILFGVVVTLQVLPCCLPVDLNKSRQVYAVAVFGQLLGKLCSGHLTLIRIFKGLQAPFAKVLNERFHCVGVVVFQQFRQGVLLVRVFCEEFFLLNGGGGHAPCLQDCFVKSGKGRFAVLPHITAGKALGRTVGVFHLADRLQKGVTSESVEHDRLKWFVWYVDSIRGQAAGLRSPVAQFANRPQESCSRAVIHMAIALS